jgi:hypothetical protein
MSTTSSDSIVAERAEIDADIEGKTLCDLLARNPETYANRPALFWKEGGLAMRMSRGYVEPGIGRRHPLCQRRV